MQGLSYIGGVNLLLEEGYIEEDCIETDDESCDKLFLYPFSLYKDGNLIDRAFANKLHGDDFLQAMADIYSENEVRKILDQYPHDVLRKAKSMPPKQFEDEYDNLYNELSLRNNYEAFWTTVRNYINASLKS